MTGFSYQPTKIVLRRPLESADYAFITFNTNTPELNLKMPELILQAVVANRYVMREIPRLLRQMDVKLTHTMVMFCSKSAPANIFQSCKNYGPIAVSAGLAVQSEFESWIEAIDRALSENLFFGSCNFVTYGLAKAN